ncbi:MAG: IMP cyclohydrolase [Spirochaetaceae bacterium]|nr:MAG: IMP cyclohydrolase [Spirochaetaceae bacterium]
MSDLRSAYSRILPDTFPGQMELSFIDGTERQTLVYEKVEWNIDGERKGLRYGENPDQPAALYKLINGNLCLGEVECLSDGKHLVSDVELLQSGKHPGKINITDADSALGILRYLQTEPAVVIVKHNNPCGVAVSDTLESAYRKAYLADAVAAFGGTVAVNRELDRASAEAIMESYSEVVVAPDYAPGVLDILAKRKNLRVLRIANMERLAEWMPRRVLDAKSLMDGGLILQWSYVSSVTAPEHFLPARCEFQGTTYEVKRSPSDQEYKDLLFGWLVESGVTSNSVLYVKDGVTVGIGTGEQDRVGVAEIARDKAYKRNAERLARTLFGRPLSELTDPEERKELDRLNKETNGGLRGAVMVSDAFFPFRDGIEVGLREGVVGVVQPGGSLRDYESIEACNEYNATMVFTGQRSFRH